MPLDIAQLTRDALLHSGCDAGIIDQLDSHSPIELNFKAQPSIHIVLLGESQVRLECNIMENVQWNATQVAANLLHEVAHPAPWSTSQATSLVDTNGIFKLTVGISEDYLSDATLFADAIDGFYKRVVQVLQVLHA